MSLYYCDRCGFQSMAADHCPQCSATFPLWYKIEDEPEDEAEDEPEDHGL